MKIAILYEDQDVLAINKPIKLNVANLLVELQKKYPEAVLAHRLDRDTSGVMVVAKNAKAYEFLKKQFKDRKVKKVYQTIVVGELKPEEGRHTGTIMVSIGRHPSDARRRATGKGATEPRRDAVTHYQILKNYPGYTHIEARPATGRTHQLRVHFKHLGHPILGDRLYNQHARNKFITRQALHAHKLTIILPDKATKEFVAPLPLDFRRALAELEQLC